MSLAGSLAHDLLLCLVYHSAVYTQKKKQRFFSLRRWFFLLLSSHTRTHVHTHSGWWAKWVTTDHLDERVQFSDFRTFFAAAAAGFVIESSIWTHNHSTLMSRVYLFLIVIPSSSYYFFFVSRVNSCTKKKTNIASHILWFFFSFGFGRVSSNAHFCLSRFCYFVCFGQQLLLMMMMRLL